MQVTQEKRSEYSQILKLLDSENSRMQLRGKMRLIEFIEKITPSEMLLLWEEVGI